MPRNASGTYSLPEPPVVSGATILDTDENSTRSDMATEITASLDRSGRGAMLAPLRLYDGSLAVPGLAFSGDIDTGGYRIGANNWALVAGGVNVGDIKTTGIELLTPKLGTPQSGVLTNCTGLPVAGGGTGKATLTANNVLLGNGTSAIAEVAPGTSGNLLTSNGTTWQSTAPVAVPSAFASGTVMLFVQTAAPTGWTKLVVTNDAALRVVTGAASTGGLTAFTSVFGASINTGSTAADLAAHTHTATTSGESGHTHSAGSYTVGSINSAGSGGVGPFSIGDAANTPIGAVSGTSGASSGHTHTLTTASTGSGGGHTHTMGMNLKYVDVIQASKD